MEMELNEDVEMSDKANISKTHQNNLVHKIRSNNLKLKRKRNRKDNNDYFEDFSSNNLIYDYSKNSDNLNVYFVN